MSDIRARLAEALRKAMFEDPDWAFVGNPNQLADALLSLPGIAIVELPEADTDGRFRFRGSCYVYADPEDGLIMTQRGTTHGVATEARETAAALLAAAIAAEQAELCDEWLAAVAGMTEIDRAPYDDPQTYADTMDPNGNRL